MNRFALASGIALAALVACGSTSERGVAVTIRVDSPGATTLTTDFGYTVELEHAAVTLSSFEIVPCGAAATVAGRRIPWLSSGVAHAHTLSVPRRLGVPAVAVLRSPTSLEPGRLEPPAGHYCTLRVTFARADDDAVGLSGEPTILGSTLVVRGVAKKGELAVPFEVMTAATTVANLAIDLRLSDSARDATLRTRVEATHLFDGIDFAAATEEEIEASVLKRASSACSVDVE